MKTLTKLMLTSGAAFLIATAPTWAAPSGQPAYFTITSPDHPDTWVTGAMQKSRALRWDADRQQLMVDVKYSTEDYADSVNPACDDDHTLAFPNVRLANNRVDLVAVNHRGESRTIGRLSSGLLGSNVDLAPGVALRVHRIEGKIHASLVYNSLMRE